MELSAHRSYSELDFDINFWRTKTGLEVDFILGRGKVAVEVKGTSRVDPGDMEPLLALVEEYSPRQAYIVCNERARREHRGLTIIPWREFLQDLWDGRILC